MTPASTVMSSPDIRSWAIQRLVIMPWFFASNQLAIPHATALLFYAARESGQCESKPLQVQFASSAVLPLNRATAAAVFQCAAELSLPRRALQRQLCTTLARSPHRTVSFDAAGSCSAPAVPPGWGAGSNGRQVAAPGTAAPALQPRKVKCTSLPPVAAPGPL